MERQLVNLLPRPHPLARKNGLMIQVEFLGLEAHYGMCNHGIIPWCLVHVYVSAKTSVSETKCYHGYSFQERRCTNHLSLALPLGTHPLSTKSASYILAAL